MMQTKGITKTTHMYTKAEARWSQSKSKKNMYNNIITTHTQHNLGNRSNGIHSIQYNENVLHRVLKLDGKKYRNIIDLRKSVCQCLCSCMRYKATNGRASPYHFQTNLPKQATYLLVLLLMLLKNRITTALLPVSFIINK